MKTKAAKADSPDRVFINDTLSTEEPKQDPAMGDKTPAWMEWLKANNPQEYAKRYENRVTPVK